MQEKHKKDVEELGALQFSEKEICIILGLNYSVIDNEFNRLYNRGRLQASAAVRKEILTQAINGSTPAQKQMIDLIEKASEFSTVIMESDEEIAKKAEEAYKKEGDAQ